MPVRHHAGVMDSILVVGYGEVGKPIYEIARGVYPKVDWLDIQEREVGQKPRVMHICYPEQESKNFISSSVRYVDRFSPELVLIESTVSVGTTSAIYERLTKKPLMCHSPVRGNISEGMKKDLFQYTKYIGPVTLEAGVKAKEYYESLGLRARICSSPGETELGKLFETTYRGLMMSWFQEINRICGNFGASFDQVVDFIGSTEREGKQARPVFHPGVIGGHCIMPNAKKLFDSYPSEFVKAMLDSNELRAKEIKNEQEIKNKDSPR